MAYTKDDTDESRPYTINPELDAPFIKEYGKAFSEPVPTDDQAPLVDIEDEGEGDDKTTITDKFKTTITKGKEIATSLNKETKKQILQGFLGFLIPKKYKAGYAKGGIKKQDWLRKVALLDKQHGWDLEKIKKTAAEKAKLEGKKSLDTNLMQQLTGDKEGYMFGRYYDIPKELDPLELFQYMENSFGGTDSQAIEYIKNNADLSGNWTQVIKHGLLKASRTYAIKPGGATEPGNISLWHANLPKLFPNLSKYGFIADAFGQGNQDQQKDVINDYEESAKEKLPPDSQDPNISAANITLDENSEKEVKGGTVVDGVIEPKTKSEIADVKRANDIIRQNDLNILPEYYPYKQKVDGVAVNKNNLPSSLLEEAVLFTNVYEYKNTDFKNNRILAKKIVNTVQNLNSNYFRTTDANGKIVESKGYDTTIEDAVVMIASLYPEFIETKKADQSELGYVPLKTPNKNISYYSETMIRDAQSQDLRGTKAIDSLQSLTGLVQPVTFISDDGRKRMVDADVSYLLKLKNWFEGAKGQAVGFGQWLNWADEIADEAIKFEESLIKQHGSNEKYSGAVNRARQNIINLQKSKENRAALLGTAEYKRHVESMNQGQSVPGFNSSAIGMDSYKVWLAANFGWDGEWTNSIEPMKENGKQVLGPDGKPKYYHIATPLLSADMEKKFEVYRNASQSVMQTIFAYQLSSSVQGYQAGGRTISNFDYQIVATAMAFDGMRSPDQMRAALGVAKTFMYKDYYGNHFMAHPQVGQDGKYDLIRPIFFGAGGLFDQAKARGFFATSYGDPVPLEPLYEKGMLPDIEGVGGERRNIKYLTQDVIGGDEGLPLPGDIKENRPPQIKKIKTKSETPISHIKKTIVPPVKKKIEQGKRLFISPKQWFSEKDDKNKP